MAILLYKTIQIDTQNNLEWLKKVKDSKGSVEINAFAQVEKINREGIYIIGNIDAANTKVNIS